MAADPALLAAMSAARLGIEGRMPNSSNATYLVTFTDHEGAERRGIYKPLLGERPLWDFEPGLWRREVAAFVLSEALGWDLVPPTVAGEGPLGEGSLQLFVPHDPNVHYFTLHECRPDLHDVLRRLAIFDIVANNTDRKGGHVILCPDDVPRGIDHGVCFSDEFKLRTVIWDFGGEEMDDALVSPVAALVADPAHCAGLFAGLLDDGEVEALVERAAWIDDVRRFPSPSSRYQYPWPLL